MDNMQITVTGPHNECCAEIRDRIREDENLDRKVKSQLDVILERVLYLTEGFESISAEITFEQITNGINLVVNITRLGD